MNEKLFADRLRAIRIARGMSQEEMAKKLGTSKQVISRYETAQRIPKISAVEEYAKKLGVDIMYFLGGNDSANIDCLSEAEKELIGYFRTMTAESRQSILQISANLAALGQQKNNADPAVETA